MNHLSILESIRFWKKNEQDRLHYLQQVSPQIFEERKEGIEEWLNTLHSTVHLADRWIAYIQTTSADQRQEDEPVLLTEFIRFSTEQSARLITQLETLNEQNNDHATLASIIQQTRDYAQQAQEKIARDIPQEATLLTAARLEPPTTHESVPIGGHTLPPLPYAYDALEPYIDEKTMRLHHDIHHQAYVDGLNKAERQLQTARETNNFDLVKHWERELAFNGAGHYLHTIFWDIMSPKGGGTPTGLLAAQIKKDFGSYEAFKAQFSAAAEAVEGGGWAILVWSPRSRRLEILQAEKHQNLSQWDVIPLLVLDVWEHAYYLKYMNKRAEYIDHWWNIVNWPAVEQRFSTARNVTWTPY